MVRWLRESKKGAAGEGRIREDGRGVGKKRGRKEDREGKREVHGIKYGIVE